MCIFKRNKNLFITKPVQKRKVSVLGITLLKSWDQSIHFILIKENKATDLALNIT
jgi:hypothetical protein